MLWAGGVFRNFSRYYVKLAGAAPLLAIKCSRQKDGWAGPRLLDYGRWSAALSFGGGGTLAVHRPELGQRSCFFSVVGSGPWTPTTKVFLLLRTTLRTRTPTVSGVLPCTFSPTWDRRCCLAPLLLQQLQLRGCPALLHRDCAEEEGL